MEKKRLVLEAIEDQDETKDGIAFHCMTRKFKHRIDDLSSYILNNDSAKAIAVAREHANADVRHLGWRRRRLF